MRKKLGADAILLILLLLAGSWFYLGLASQLMQTYEMAAVGRFRRYVPDTTSQGFLLGTGGCSSQVERFARSKYNKFARFKFISVLLITLTNSRYYQQGTTKAVAVKRVPQADIEALAGLFDNEVAALTAAIACGFRRVSTFLEEAFCENGDRCLVLE